MAQRYFGTAADTLEDGYGARVPDRKIWTYLDDEQAEEFTDWYADEALTEPVVPTSDERGYIPTAWCDDATPTLWGGAGLSSDLEPTYVAQLVRRDATSGGGGGGPVTDGDVPASIARDTEVAAAVAAEAAARAAAVTAAVNAAIDALVAGAPGALNTLDELAAAVNDDASFAATVTAALAARPLSADVTAQIEAALADEVVRTDATYAVIGHTQPSSTITDFTEAVQDAVAALLGAGSNITLNYNDAGNTLTVTGVGDGTGLDAEAVRDAIGVALVGVGNIAVTVNDALDTITISTTATANSTDAQLRDRSTHTGTQAAASISDLTEIVQDLVAAMVVAGANVTKTYDDTAGTLTIAASSGSSSTVPAAPTTLDPSAGLVLHLAADNIDGVAAGGAVEVWRDISGRSNHVQNTTSGQRPTLQTGVVNGKPVVRFDATDDTLQAVSAGPLDKHLLKPFTFFVVLSAPNFTVDRKFWGESGVGGALYLAITTAGKVNIVASAVTTILVSTGSLTAGTFSVVEITYNEVGACAVFLNGTASGTATVNATFTPGLHHKIGSASGLDIAEYLIYDRALGSTDRAAIRALLGTKYGITVS